MENGAMISQNVLGDSAILITPGKVVDNSNAHEMSDIISEAQERGYIYIIIDMRQVEFLSSAGVGSILGSIQTSRDRGGDIVLVSPSEKTVHILEILDLCEYLTIKTDEQIEQEFPLKQG
jgi:anti-sigma B factor antagonist